MKTEYLREIKDMLNATFTPAFADTVTAIPKTLEQIHSMVISVLPAKWIYESDVYTALEELSFTTSYGKIESVDNSDGLYYFVLLK